MKQVEITVGGKHIYIRGDYDSYIYEELKQVIPGYARKWVSREKMWVVNAEHLSTVVSIFELSCRFNVTIVHSKVEIDIVNIERDVIRLMYLGTAKDRGDGIKVANGTTGKRNRRNLIWDISVEMSVLTAHFNPAPTNAFSLLGVSATSTDNEIKTAYRQIIKLYHPDVNKSEEAESKFELYTEAYQKIKTEQLRKGYNRRLQLASRFAQNDDVDGWSDGYRSPKTCGIVTFAGKLQYEYITIEHIFSWDDIVDGNKVLRTYYNNGNIGETYEEIHEA